MERGPDDTEPLAATLVRYADGPDRATLHPPDEPPLADSWLSVDARVLVSTAAFR
ncbi:DUF7511 domain-containing protein [Halosegnis marinus]|uniref:DUF7511 domain-containing protein n=1 Tax=Halosegnis marinus TaxID=3034023 RepID=A0ABD5ZT09_9EURY|nr:hypothetical protein [Halosegnis sp. DT85]